MDVIVETTGSLERRMRVEMPITTINQQIDSRLKSVGKNAKLKGFRPGKVPAKIIKQRYGRQVREEVVGEVLQKSYAQAISEQGLKPAGQPKIEAEDENGKTFLFTATFEVMPEIKLKDLEKIKTDKIKVSIQDDDIDEMILNLRKQKAIWKKVDRKSTNGDRVVIDFEGKLKGDSFPGGNGKEFPVTLGSGQMLPDFEKGLKGVSIGDEKTFKVKFPKDYHSKDLAGKKADFTISVHRVEEENLPKLDANFIKDFNVDDGNVDQFKKEIEENMNREAELKIKSITRDQAMSGLLENNPIDIPKVLKFQEMQALQQDAMQRMGLEDISKAPKIENFSEAAEKRVAFGLLLNQLVVDKDIKVDDEMLRNHVEELCAGYENADDMIDMYMKNPQVMQQIKPMVLERLAIEWIIKNGSSKSKKISFKKFMNSP